MSGGVDSSVAALLLKNGEHSVHGVYLSLRAQVAEEEREDARRMAEFLDIPFTVLDFRRSFSENIIDYFKNSYQNALTPNPCFRCNARIKFGALADYALEKGFDYLATGHYAHTVQRENGRWSIARGVDATKDQSYYMGAVDEKKISHLLFPLRDLKKEEVRQIARESGLPVAEKKDSQEVCFIESDYRDFLQANKVRFHPGEFRFPSGERLGEHDGRENYTIGQRRGMGIAAPQPLFVKDILPDGNVIVAFRDDLYRNELVLDNVVYQGMSAEELSEERELLVQIRYRSNAQLAKVVRDGDNLLLRSEDGFWAAAPGQAVVAYDRETNTQILLSGIIQRY